MAVTKRSLRMVRWWKKWRRNRQEHSQRWSTELRNRLKNLVSSLHPFVSTRALTTRNAAESSTRHLTKLETLSESLNAGAKAKADAASPLDESILDDFKPHLLHQPHRPFPIALVNRKPHGLFGHQDVRVPQDAAWLAGLRYAERKVFIQTPTLNARPLKHGIIEACSRGVEVELWLSVGFNDQSEGLLFQGGTNQDVTTALYQKLNAIGKGEFLKVHWCVVLVFGLWRF